MKKNVILLIISMVSIEVTLSAQNTSTKTPEVTKLSSDYNFVSNSAVENFSPFKKDAIKWPSSDKINAKKASLDQKPVKEAIETTMVWLKTMLRPEWVPLKTDLEFLPLKSDIQGVDTVRLRYKVGTCNIQVASTSGNIIIVIKDECKPIAAKPLDVDSAKIYVNSCLDRFFQDADKIKNISMVNIRENKNGIEGMPDVNPSSTVTRLKIANS